MTHRYEVMFQFDSRKKVGLKEVQACSIADALSKAHKQVLGLRMIAVHGYSNGKLPRSVTITRVTHPAKKKKGMSAST